MKFIFRKASRSVSRSPGTWLMLTLLCVVLVPSLGLLWFMNQAVENERHAVRQRLIDAYRAQLVGAQERLATNWAAAADELAERAAAASPLAVFAGAVRDGSADALICFDTSGAAAYPDRLVRPEFARPPPAWRQAQELEATDIAAAASAYARIAVASSDASLAARALQAQARCLVRGGDKNAALTVLTGPLWEDRLRQADDGQGRLVVPNADLMALELAEDIAPEQAAEIRARLRACVLDYEHFRMPAAHRRFLLRELQRREDGDLIAHMLSAEDLAAAFLAAEDHPVRDAPLRPTALPGIWQAGSADGRILLLHREDNLVERLRAVAGTAAFSADVRLDFVAPGREFESSLLSLPAGLFLPGWRMAFSARDPGLLDAATSARLSSYTWISVLVVITVVMLAVLAWGLVRRQIALTQLRNDLVANVTHELKTPLASMRLLVETLLDTPVLNERTAREYLQLIAAENLRLSRLIGNFLTFSRIERNKYSFDFQDVPADRIVAGAADAVRDRLQAPGCRFDVEIPLGLPAVTADVDAMVTALVNLLDNACKYSGDAKEITLSAAAQNGQVVFAVRDNGIGLSARDTKRIFRRFVQVRRGQAGSGGGVGLGLSIVQFIVSAHHGSIRVDSEPGRGSTFSVALPVAQTSSSSS